MIISMCIHVCIFYCFLFCWSAHDFFLLCFSFILLLLLQFSSINIEIWNGIFLALFFLLIILLGSMTLSWFYMNLLYFPFLWIIWWLLLGVYFILWNLYILFSRMVIFLILILPIHKYGLHFHLLASFSNFFFIELMLSF